MLHTGRVVGHTILFGQLHGIGRIHPTDDKVGGEGAGGIGIAGEGDVGGTGTLQCGKRQLDVFGCAYHLGDGSDVARMLGARAGEVEVGAIDNLLVVQGDARTQVHIEMLAVQAFAPLHEEAHGVAFDGETCAHEGAGCVLDGGGTVAHAHGNVEQGRVDVDGTCLGGLCRETS